MLFVEPTLVRLRPEDAPPRKVDGALHLIGSLVDCCRRQRELLDWNRNLPRPPGCRNVPDRVWRRRSALLSMRATGTLR